MEIYTMELNYNLDLKIVKYKVEKETKKAYKTRRIFNFGGKNEKDSYSLIETIIKKEDMNTKIVYSGYGKSNKIIAENLEMLYRIARKEIENKQSKLEQTLLNIEKELD